MYNTLTKSCKVENFLKDYFFQFGIIDNVQKSPILLCNVEDNRILPNPHNSRYLRTVDTPDSGVWEMSGPGIVMICSHRSPGD